MPLSHLPASLAAAFTCLARWLDKRSAARVPTLLLGALFARGRRTVTSWLRAAGITDDSRNGYNPACAVGRRAHLMAVSALWAVRPLLGPKRLRLAIDDTPAPRHGPEVEGCGIHHSPT